jgi:hypothetical protein
MPNVWRNASGCMKTRTFPRSNSTNKGFLVATGYFAVCDRSTFTTEA